MSVTCGNCTSSLGKAIGAQVRHETVAEVRECYSERYYWEAEAADERSAEDGYERFLENQGWAETMLEEQVEAARGVLSFEDAWDMFSPGTRAGYHMEEV